MVFVAINTPPAIALLLTTADDALKLVRVCERLWRSPSVPLGTLEPATTSMVFVAITTPPAIAMLHSTVDSALTLLAVSFDRHYFLGTAVS